MARAHPLLALTLALVVGACAAPADEPGDAGLGDGASPPPDAQTPGLTDASSIADGGRAPLDSALSPDSGPPVEARVGVFVATGNVGRTIASFDDGHSWEADRSDAEGEICTVTSRAAGPANFCFEGDRSARGVAFLDGHFFTTFAWAREPGRTNSVRSSADARTWSPVLEPGGFGGVAAGGGVVVLAGPSGTTYMMRSTDLGASWDRVPNGYGDWTNFRRVTWVRAHGGRFVFAADGNGIEAHRFVISADGERWSLPTSVADACPTNFRHFGGIGSVGDRIIVVGSDGRVCFSDDGGLRWRAGEAVPRPTSHDVVSTGTSLMVWSRDTRFETEDGETWRRMPLVPSDVSIGPVARSPDTGTFVAVTSGYLNGYARQRFYRSEDGVRWEPLAGGAFVASHPILSIEYGLLPRE